jgi:hypothetical protein
MLDQVAATAGGVLKQPLIGSAFLARPKETSALCSCPGIRSDADVLRAWLTGIGLSWSVAFVALDATYGEGRIAFRFPSLERAMTAAQNLNHAYGDHRSRDAVEVDGPVPSSNSVVRLAESRELSWVK